MKIKTLLLINGILTALYAVMLLFMRENFLEMRGMHTDAYGMFIILLFGVPSQTGYAVLNILVSRSQNQETLQLVSTINFITWTLGLIILLYGKMKLEMSAMVWGDIAFAMIFSIAFAYYVFSKQIYNYTKSRKL